MNGENARKCGPVQILRIHTVTNQRLPPLICVEIRLAQVHSAMTRLAILWNKAIAKMVIRELDDPT